MQIRGRIHSNEEDIFRYLTRKGVVVKREKRSMLFDLKITAGLLEPGPEYCEIPRAVKDVSAEVVYLIEASEKGGLRLHDGNGTIVCGLKGKRLRPYYVPRKKNGPTAFFSAVGGLSTVTAYFHEGTFMIMNHKIKENSNGFLYIESLTVGFGSFLPSSLSHYTEAVQAAKEKAACINCNCVHFCSR